MRHLNKGRKLKRKPAQRKALMRSMASSLILYGKIKTTEAKAKNLKPIVEKLVSKAKEGETSMRLIRKDLSLMVTKKLLEVAKEYKQRTGGYLRIVKLGQRKSDGSKIAFIEFV